MTTLEAAGQAVAAHLQSKPYRLETVGGRVTKKSIRLALNLSVTAFNRVVRAALDSSPEARTSFEHFGRNSCYVPKTCAVWLIAEITGDGSMARVDFQ